MKHSILFILLFHLVIVLPLVVEGQCDPNVPTFIVNLQTPATYSWISSDTARLGNCCGTSSPDRCVKFIVILPTGASGLSFNIHSGAKPPGALFYQINCGQQTAVGDSICLSGVGPHIITFCKPGANENQYRIDVFPDPGVSANIAINDGCTGILQAYGYYLPTIRWNSIYPDTFGHYNNYLNCSIACDSVVVVGQVGYPPYIDYQVCGLPEGGCDTLETCDTVRVFLNSTLTASILPQDPTVCFGGTNATLTAHGGGGTPPYRYYWSTNDTSQSISVDTGTYIVTVFDTTDCPPTYDTVTVTAFSLPIEAQAGNNLTSCDSFAQLNGNVIAASGGTWWGGAGTFSPHQDSLNAIYYPDSLELAIGYSTLFLTTTGNGSCPADTDTIVIYYEIFDDTISFSIKHVSCAGMSDAQINISSTTHKSPFVYLWSTSDSTQDLTGIDTGIYILQIQDSNGCTYIDSFVITQPLPLLIVHDSANISCNGGSDGSITLTVSGGTTPYNYNWSSNDSTANPSGLQSGMYGVTVTDSNNCQILDSVFLSEPLLLMLSDSINQINCNGDSSGSITLFPQGGTLPYQFNWSDGPTSSTRDSLVPGLYIVVLTDSNSCQYSDSFLITQPLPLSVIHDSTNISCNGGNDGSITLTVSGGTTPYNYYWTSNDSTANLSGLQSGMYGVTVTDSNNCQRLDSVFLSEPLLLMFTDSIKPIYCYGDNSGIISLSPQGGTLPYQFNWSDGPMSSTRDSLVPGIYKVVLTDSNSCQYSDSFLITQPLPLSVIHDSTNISCNGGNDGSITLTVSGGTLPYQFNWSDGPTSSTRNNLVPGIYKVVVTDSNSCQYSDSFLITQPLAGQIIFNTQNIKCFNDSSGSIILSFSGGTTPYLYSWSSGQTTKDITNVPSGKYIITVTDSNNCLYQDSVQLFEPSPIISSGTIDSLTCYGSSDGHISISVSGGISPYTFLWNTSNTTSAISGLKEGNYFVLIKDSNQCQYKDTFAVYQPDSLMITSQLNHVKCFGDSSGSIDLSVFGGTKPYQFVWSNNLNNEDIFNLVSALYSVQIVDKNGCFRKDTFIIEQPADIQIFATTKNVCKGLDDGWINTTVIGGSLLYSYNWSTGQTIEDIQNLQAGIYILKVTDSNGCTQKDTFEIFENLDTMQIHSNIHHISCYRYQNGNINLSISGGTNPFQYFWSNGKNTQDIDSLDIGTYTIKIIDSIRCEAFDTFIITEPDKLKTIMQGTDVSCFEFADGSASVINSGGTTPYSYNWSNGEQTQQINNLDTGIYYVTVTDSNACQIKDTLRITQPPELLISSKVNNILCHGQQNGYINLTLSGGIPSFILTWSNGKTGTYLNNLSAGTYNVIIEQANNCLNYDTFEIIEPDSLYLNYNKINEGCKGDKNGSIDVEVFGGIKPYQYIWNNNSKKEDINGLEVGAFLIVVTDSNGCTINSDSIHITAYPLPKPIILPDNNVTICNDSFAIFKIQQNYIVYDWNTGQSTQSITVNEDGEFFAIVTDINGCKGKSETRYLTVLDPTTFVDLKPEYIFCPDDGPLTLAPKVSMNGDFLWEPTGETTKNIVVDEEGIYIVHLDVNGCVSSDSTFIKEICPPVVQVPSAFTPNGDGLNDVFQLFTLYVDTLYYIIFDRWGEIIFRGYSKNDTWDGCYKNDLVEVETYAYLLWYYNELVGWRNKNGRITIIR